MGLHRGDDEVVGMVVCLGQRVGLYEIEPLVTALLDTANFPLFIEDFLENGLDSYVIHQIHRVEILLVSSGRSTPLLGGRRRSRVP
ncbi:hypothetical protein LCGC14_1848680 [marine sediment metagenome]|uniref:Uncharacterized protein n=1 Tax=marine sediment metagenome TaxID=412755 RepID=A0A0F9GB90_9ZZZZ